MADTEHKPRPSIAVDMALAGESEGFRDVVVAEMRRLTPRQAKACLSSLINGLEAAISAVRKQCY